MTKPNHAERSKSKFVVVELQECSFNTLCAHKTCVTLMRNGMLHSKKLHKQLGEFAGQRSVKLFYVMEVPALPVAWPSDAGAPCRPWKNQRTLLNPKTEYAWITAKSSQHPYGISHIFSHAYTHTHTKWQGKCLLHTVHLWMLHARWSLLSLSLCRKTNILHASCEHETLSLQGPTCLRALSQTGAIAGKLQT